METERAHSPNRGVIRVLGIGLVALGLIFLAAQTLRFAPRIVRQRTVMVERPAEIVVSVPEIPEIPEMPAMPEMPELPEMPEIAAPNAIEVHVGSNFDHMDGTFVANTARPPALATIIPAALGGFFSAVLLMGGLFLFVRSRRRRKQPPTSGPAADPPPVG